MRLAIVVAAWLIAYALNPELLNLEHTVDGLGIVLVLVVSIYFVLMDVLDFSRRA